MKPEDFCDPFAIVTEAEYVQTIFDCIPKSSRVAIIAYACGTTPGAANTVRDFNHDIRHMVATGVRHIDQVAEFAEKILNSTAFDEAHFDEWVDMFGLDFCGNMFRHILLEMNEDMLEVVRFCYPFDDERNLILGGEILFYTAFCSKSSPS